MKAKTVLFVVMLSTGVGLFGQAEGQTSRVREFVVMGYQGIALELASGKGPYLNTLFDLLNAPTDTEKKTTDQLKSLLKAYPNIMDFADQVVLLKSEDAPNRAPADLAVPSGPGIYSGDRLMGALEHLTRGMNVSVTLKTGERLQGTFSDYSQKRLWIRGAARPSVRLDDILSLEAPQL